METRWIPVTERLPELHMGKSATVLVYGYRSEQTPFNAMDTFGYLLDNGEWREFDGYHEPWPLIVTHWMPRPEPPEEYQEMFGLHKTT